MFERGQLTDGEPMPRFQGILLTTDEAGFSARVTELDELVLNGDGEVVVQVERSSLNYKDGLAITNRSPVVRKWPMVPGIDCTGVVDLSSDPRFQRGDAVIVTGWKIGELYWGGLAERARFKGDWLLPRPQGMDGNTAMAIGTAGLTAMLSVLSLERHGIKPAQGDVLVTGASGGVGSLAVAILAQLGYRVVASTGRLKESGYLAELGAHVVMDRAELSGPGNPLQKERFAAVVDTVGSHTLANACAQVKYGGAVAACGLAQGMDFPATVAPFILRAVALYGIDSVLAPEAARVVAWRRLTSDLDPVKLLRIASEISLHDALEAATAIVSGGVRGRLVVSVRT
jgi:acrylyl-CoA reductase (NADPH)